MRLYKVPDNVNFLIVIFLTIIACKQVPNDKGKSANNVLETTKVEEHNNLTKSEQEKEDPIVTYNREIEFSNRKIEILVDSIGFPGEHGFNQRVIVKDDLKSIYKDSIGSPLCVLSLPEKPLTSKDLNSDLTKEILFTYLNGCDGEDPGILNMIVIGKTSLLRIHGEIPYYFENESYKNNFFEKYIPQIQGDPKSEKILISELYQLWKLKSKEILIDEGILDSE